MASEGYFGILPLPRCSGKLAAARSLPAPAETTVEESITPTQSARRDVVGADERSLRSMDSTPSCFASLPQGTFRRQNPRWKPYALKRSYGFVRGVPSDRYPYRDSQITRYKLRALPVNRRPVRTRRKALEIDLTSLHRATLIPDETGNDLQPRKTDHRSPARLSDCRRR